MAYLLREADGTVTVVQDRHRLGVFPRATWLHLLGAEGFVRAATCATGYEEEEPGAEGCLAVKGNIP